MRKILFLIVIGLAYIECLAQPESYEKELLNLFDISRLPQYPVGDVYQLSSYDRTDGNDDGFSGKYSYIRKEGDDLVVADIKGAGVINRIWTPTPTQDTIQFFFDGEIQPRISMPFIDLFSGKIKPFVAPLCGNEIGGYYCYLPIPYAKSLKIVYKGSGLKFHQIQYRELSGEVESFSWDWFDNTSLMDEIIACWSRTPLSHYGNKVKTENFNFTVHKGEEKKFFELLKGGRIVGLEFDAGYILQEESSRLLLKANWDNESNEAIDASFQTLFGYVAGKPSMNSMLLGATSAMCYSYLPMPFDKKAKLSVEYKNSDSSNAEITLSGRVYYLLEKRDRKCEGRFYAQMRREYLPLVGVPYTIADIRGKGHYVGTVLMAQGLDEGMTLFWEGDDCTVVDGDMRLHGTGSEDYFNGGWYAVTDRWDRGISLPIHGSLIYELKTSRTGGYRFYLSDKIGFDSSFKLTIEHGPEGNQLNVDYASVGLFYADSPQFINKPLFDISHEKLRRDILLPQDMAMKLYWHTQVAFDGNSMIISSQDAKHWAFDIDFEAIPMLQLDLTGMDNGKYKVYVVHTGVGENKPFSVWQRTKQLSDWIMSQGESQSTSFVGEIEVSNQIKTLTIRRKKNDNAVLKIDSFIFEKIAD